MLYFLYYFSSEFYVIFLLPFPVFLSTTMDIGQWTCLYYGTFLENFLLCFMHV